QRTYRGLAQDDGGAQGVWQLGELSQGRLHQGQGAPAEQDQQLAQRGLRPSRPPKIEAWKRGQKFRDPGGQDKAGDQQRVLGIEAGVGVESALDLLDQFAKASEPGWAGGQEGP